MTATVNKTLAPTAFNLGLVQAVIPLNDECINAIPVLFGFNGPFDITGATTSPPFACVRPGPNIWFTYQPAVTKRTIFSTCRQTTFDTVIDVFSGTCTNLTLVACIDDGICGLDAVLDVNLTAGSYFLRVGKYLIPWKLCKVGELLICPVFFFASWIWRQRWYIQHVGC